MFFEIVQKSYFFDETNSLVFVLPPDKLFFLFSLQSQLTENPKQKKKKKLPENNNKKKSKQKTTK